MRLVVALATVTILLAGCGGNSASEDESGTGEVAEGGGEQTDGEDESAEEPDED